LPTYGNQQFRIRDFGPGMDPDKVETRYTEYFYSDKTDTNDQTGQFGLGSKSPFCYANQFMVINRHKGFKTVYTCFIREGSEVEIDDDGNVTGGDDGGFPAIGTLEGPIKCDEPSGLEVIIPTKGGDRYSWEEEAKRVYKYFDLRPKVTFTGTQDEVEIPTVEYQYGGVDQHWGIRTGRVTGEAHVIMGNVCYPLTIKDQDTLPSHMQLFTDTAFDLYMPIGSLQMTPSRESLQNTPRNQAILLHALERVSKSIYDTIQAEIDKSPSLWDARRVLSQMQTNGTAFYRMSRMCQVDRITWNGKNVSTSLLHFNGFAKDIRAFEFFVERRHRYGDYIPESAVKRNVRTEISPSHNLRIVENDLKRGAFTRCKRNISYVSAEEGQEPRFFLVEFHTDAAREGFLNLIGGNRTHLEKVSDLPNLASKRQTKSYRSIKELVWERDRWESSEVDIEDGGFYVSLLKDDIKETDSHPFYRLYAFDQIVRDYESIFRTSLEIFGFRGRVKKTITNSDLWQDAIDYIKDEVKGYIDADVMQQILNVESISKEHIRHYHTWFTGMCKLLANYSYAGTPLEEYAKTVLSLQKDYKELNGTDKFRRLLAQFDIKLVGTKPEKSFAQLTEEIIPHYPLLAYIFKVSNTLSGDALKDAIQYMTDLDQERTGN